MNFLAPVFAGLTFLGILPVLIHLHGRRRAKVRPLPTLMILLASHRRVAQRTKLRQLLLLLVRVLVMVAIPLCLAKPFIETASDLPAQVSAAQSAVLLLDDSLSMNYQPEHFDRIFRGKVTAREALTYSLNVPAVEMLDKVGPAAFEARLDGVGVKLVRPKAPTKRVTRPSMPANPGRSPLPPPACTLTKPCWKPCASKA